MNYVQNLKYLSTCTITICYNLNAYKYRMAPNGIIIDCKYNYHEKKVDWRGRCGKLKYFRERGTYPLPNRQPINAMCMCAGTVAAAVWPVAYTTPCTADHRFGHSRHTLAIKKQRRIVLSAAFGGGRL